MIRREGEEQPYINLKLFKLRFPGIHYRIEAPEFVQGLIIGTTALSTIAILTEYLGISFEIAWGIVIIEVFLYMLHSLLGDPVVPGWITPALPLSLAYILRYEIGQERLQALMALQILVALIFIVMGITKSAEKLLRVVPNSIKGGILLSASISAVFGEFKDGGRIGQYPITLIVGFLLVAFITFSEVFNKMRSKNKILNIISSYGTLIPLLLALGIGIIIGELPKPVFEIGTVIKFVNFKEIINTTSIFAVGFPSLKLFINAIPLAIVIYIIAFGDFVTSETLVKEVKECRDDEKIDFDANRSNLISGIRNSILAFIAPFPPLSGPLWAGATATIALRYKDGRKAMDSLIGGMGTFRLATFISVIIIPIVSIMKPIFPIGMAITLLTQGFICARLAMEYCKTDTDKGIAGFMAVILFTKGAAWGLISGILLHFILVGFKKENSKVE